MDVSEKRRTQNGAVTVSLSGSSKRLRLSTVADYRNRESLVIRFLYDFLQQKKLATIFPKQLERIEEKVQKTGLYLFCGQTGSGKTTTMYYLAQLLAKKSRQVIAIEDPVEIEMVDFLQLQTNEKIDMNYEELVKVCLRHRPDILIVGEVRDSATAKMVIRAALTGHTVFSTIHTINKEGVIKRLLDLGADKEELKQCLSGVIYQRMLPVYCYFCDQSNFQSQCTHFFSHQAVLYDTIFFQSKNRRIRRQASSWENLVRKAWAYGYINQQTYQQNI